MPLASRYHSRILPEVGSFDLRLAHISFRSLFSFPVKSANLREGLRVASRSQYHSTSLPEVGSCYEMKGLMRLCWRTLTNPLSVSPSSGTVGRPMKEMVINGAGSTPPS